MSETCPVCQRMIHHNDMTIHHYLPKCEGGCIDDTIRMCKTCHRTLHFCIPLEEVKDYDTVEKLESHSLFAKFIDWIRKKTHSSHYTPKKAYRKWSKAS